MAVRTTADAVKAILLDHYDTADSPSLVSFIEIASALVDDVDTCDTDGTLSTTRLEQIERYLAAHLYLLADQAAKAEETGEAKIQYQGKTDEVGIKGTQYGQTALTLDSTGCLADQDDSSLQGGKPTIGATWIGKPKSSQIDYEDRD